MLDIVRAARQVPGSGLTETDPTYAWGYSQGGQAVGWAGELQSSYAPERETVRRRGRRRAREPARIRRVHRTIDRLGARGPLGDRPGVGLSRIKLGTLTAAGEKAVGSALSECVIELITSLNGANFRNTRPNTRRWPNSKPPNLLRKALEEQNLDEKPVPAPVYHYHGLEDELVPLEPGRQPSLRLVHTRRQRRLAAVSTAEHLFTSGIAAGNALQLDRRTGGGQDRAEHLWTALDGRDASGRGAAHARGRRPDREAERMVAERQGDRELRAHPGSAEGRDDQLDGGRHHRHADSDAAHPADQPDVLGRTDPGDGQWRADAHRARRSGRSASAKTAAKCSRAPTARPTRIVKAVKSACSTCRSAARPSNRSTCR